MFGLQWSPGDPTSMGYPDVVDPMWRAVVPMEERVGPCFLLGAGATVVVLAVLLPVVSSHDLLTLLGFQEHATHAALEFVADAAVAFVARPSRRPQGARDDRRQTARWNPFMPLLEAEYARYHAATGRIPITAIDRQYRRRNERVWFGVEHFDCTGKPELSEAYKLMRSIYNRTLAGSEMSSVRVETARIALELSRDCVLAHILLAEESAATVTEAATGFEKAVAAAESHMERLRMNYLNYFAAKIWYLPETRAYVIAQLRLALCYRKMNRQHHAVSILKTLLNYPGVAELGFAQLLIMDVYMSLGHTSSCQYIVDQHSEVLDKTFVGAFTKVILLMDRKSDNGSLDAAAIVDNDHDRLISNAMLAAIEHNPHIVKFLLGEKPIIMPTMHYHPSQESEALVFAAQFEQAWQNTPQVLSAYRSVINFTKQRLATVRCPPVWAEQAERHLLPVLPTKAGIDVTSTIEGGDKVLGTSRPLWDEDWLVVVAGCCLGWLGFVYAGMQWTLP